MTLTEEMIKLRDMPLHGVLTIGADCEVMRVMRVTGGWIYTTYQKNGTGGFNLSSCFVPQPEEF